MTALVTGRQAAVRPGVTWRDIAWLTWHQHRIAVALTASGVLGAIAMMVWVSTQAGDLPAVDLPVESVTRALLWATAAFGALIAVFWAAPLLAREYEQGTHVMAWSQDLRPGRWLIGKTVLLGATAMAMAASLGTAATAMVNQVNAMEGRYFHPFSLVVFDARPLVQVGHAAFGFALGLAFSALTRQTVLSMGLTLLVYSGVRLLVALVLRPYYQSPVREVYPTAAYSLPSGPYQDSLHIAAGYADAAGNAVPYPNTACSRLFANADDYWACLRSNGAVNQYIEYQPVDRLGTFQAVEFGLFMLLAAALVTVALNRIHRTVGL